MNSNKNRIIRFTFIQIFADKPEDGGSFLRLSSFHVYQLCFCTFFSLYNQRVLDKTLVLSRIIY